MVQISVAHRESDRPSWLPEGPRDVPIEPWPAPVSPEPEWEEPSERPDPTWGPAPTRPPKPDPTGPPKPKEKPG